MILLLGIRPAAFGAALAIAGLAFAPTPCLAWGAEGHRIVAAIAADNLTPAARAQVGRLLDGNGKTAMMQVSTWADEIRRARLETAPWHFTDIPIRNSAYDPKRDCPLDQCSISQIQSEERALADRQLLDPIRAEALRFLIHFIGDLHQPLHSSNNDDRGGNDVRVASGDRHANLHAVWDVDVVRALGNRPEDVAAQLETEIAPAQRRSWSAGKPEDWANEAHEIAQHEIYGPITGRGGTSGEIVLSPDYAQIERVIAAEQLKKAGLRLASVLNSILTEPAQ